MLQQNRKLSDSSRDLFTIEQQQLIEDSHVAAGSIQHQQRIVSEIHAANVIAAAVRDFTQEAKELAASNEKYSRAMQHLTRWIVILTGGALFVGVGQIITQIFFPR